MWDRAVNPGGDEGIGELGGGGLAPPKIWSKTNFLEITIIFLERKKSLVTGLEPNYVFLCYCNKLQPLNHVVKCKSTFADGRY